jgi:hypothetical protein
VKALFANIADLKWLERMIDSGAFYIQLARASQRP